MLLQMQHFCFLDLGKELCSVLVFGNLRFNIIVVRINHENVASRGAVGRTHTIVRLQTRIRRKDGTENFGDFVYVLDLHDGISCCGFVVCSINFSVSFFRLPRRGLPRPYRCIQAVTGYHVCRVTTPELPRSIQTSGYRRVITPAGSF